jgi:hypothetical protein
MVAVLVLPRYLMHARSLLPAFVLCATHPTGLQAIDIELCLVWDGSEIIAHHGSALDNFAEVISIPPNLTVGDTDLLFSKPELHC